jgi:TatD DNase family protein
MCLIRSIVLIDSHCHLDFEDFADERDAVVERARAAGVAQIITISTRTESFASVSRLVDGFAEVYCTIGTHPHNAHEEADVSAEQLTALALHPKCVGIGEAGLDYHYDKTPRDIAAKVFRAHIAAARNSGLPVVIHARDADADIATILRNEMEKGAFAGVLHCFSSSAWLAELGLSLGLYISFSGILTFKNAHELRDIARRVPINRLLVETDAPYLAPVPFRGKRNEPAFVVATAQKLAEVKGVSIETIAAETSANALRLFSKIPAPVTDTEAA